MSASDTARVVLEGKLTTITDYEESSIQIGDKDIVFVVEGAGFPVARRLRNRFYFYGTEYEGTYRMVLEKIS